ncbi:hypothetical protein J3Q64DRAFT_1031177 [Phycomyces blakesleeanus]|uniref:Transmembrane protein n=1 Tax=Phycomyces blakesleeanus TaxID=4837 RepID=A0ABR3BEC3_PHYBL
MSMAIFKLELVDKFDAATSDFKSGFSISFKQHPFAFFLFFFGFWFGLVWFGLVRSSWCKESCHHVCVVLLCLSYSPLFLPPFFSFLFFSFFQVYYLPFTLHYPTLPYPHSFPNCFFFLIHFLSLPCCVPW